MDGSHGSPRIRSTALAAGAGMDYDLAIGDQGELWEWQSQEYDLQKDLLAAPCSSLWAEASNNVGDDWSMFDDQTPNVGDGWSMFDEQTPIKHCADFEFQFCDIGEIIVKDFEEGKETLQAKRRRMLQFCPENAEMTCSMTEDGLSESLQEMDFSGTDCLLNSDGIDELPEEWLVNCSQDIEPCLPAEEMNSPAAATENAVDISVHSNSSPRQQSIVANNNPAQARPTPLKAGKNIIGSKKVRTSVAFPFELVKPCSFSGDVTLNDINNKIHAPPPYKIRHKSDEEPNSLQASAISGKPVVHKTKIHTEGGKGSITITRTRG
ncbi:protein XRI1-like isoform X2 [Miscanthus floridulus]|uniref:protein XRI1-like isoform X2 n=1 Tax=Miscanthus floridulus TaxID=154761 RepID=UPI003458AD99